MTHGDRQGEYCSVFNKQLFKSQSLAVILPACESSKKSNSPVTIPLYCSKISAGFPSPADDYIESQLDLNDLIKHPAATFFVRVSGNAMKDEGIYENDILIVDRSIPPSFGKMVIAVIEGQLTIKRFKKLMGKIILEGGSSSIEINDTQDIYVWGVITQVIHDMGS